MKLFATTTLVASLAALANALTMRGSLSENALPLSADDLSSTSIKLIPISSEGGNGNSKTTYLSDSGEFSFNKLQSGKYSMELQSIAFAAASSYRVDVSDEGIKVHQVFAGHDMISDAGPEVDVPVVIDVTRPTYVVPREEFSVFSMLKSPMMLMSLASLVMVFVLPKLTENIDPETMKEFQESQKQSQATMDKVQNFDMAAYMAGRSATGSSSGQQQQPQARKRK